MPLAAARPALNVVRHGTVCTTQRRTYRRAVGASAAARGSVHHELDLARPIIVTASAPRSASPIFPTSVRTGTSLLRK